MTSAGDDRVDLVAAFAELGRIHLGHSDLHGVLSRVAELAQEVIPSADSVSVTLLDGTTAGTAAFTSDLSLDLDESQYDAGYGPCLDAAAHTHINLIRSTRTDDRWPEFAQAALIKGVESTLSAGIPVGEQVGGGLNIYSTAPDAFDEASVAVAQTFAGYAAVAIANAHLYSTSTALAEQLSVAMASRAVIEQAKGILIAQRGVSADEAFDILVRASQVANRKLRDIAEALVNGAIGAGDDAGTRLQG